MNLEHLQLFHQGQWGFIIYDEVHLLPAPVFRATASIQSTRRLGLTATLVREDGKEEDVFSLIGPKRYELPWKSLEQAGYIAQAYCTEVRVPLPDSLREEYYLATVRAKMRIAQENPLKIPVLEQIIAKHQGEAILIIGQYIQQLEQIGQQLDIPVIMGKVKQMVRDDYIPSLKKENCLSWLYRRWLILQLIYLMLVSLFKSQECMAQGKRRRSD